MDKMNYYLRNKDEIDSRMLFSLLFFLGPRKTFLCLEILHSCAKKIVYGKKLCGVIHKTTWISLSSLHFYSKNFMSKWDL